MSAQQANNIFLIPTVGKHNCHNQKLPGNKGKVNRSMETFYDIIITAYTVLGQTQEFDLFWEKIYINDAILVSS